MVVSLHTMDGKIKVYETTRGEGGGENGPDKYVTKCGMEWKISPEPYETCDHIDCALDIQRRSADGGTAGFLVLLVIVTISFFWMKERGIWALAFTGFLILVGIGSLIGGFKAEDRFKELTEYKRQGTINGMRAYPTTTLTGLTTEKECIGYGLALCDKGRYDGAVEAFDKAIKLNPNSATAWNNKGIALKSQNKYDEAIVAHDKATELNPQLADAWYNKGMALYDQNKYDEAIIAYDKAINIKPKLAKAWYNKGLTFGNQGKYHEAIQAYDKAIGINPNDADVWYNKGTALRLLGRITEADETFIQAKRKWNCEGVDLYNHEKYFEAIRAYDKALAVDSKFWCAWINKGIALSKIDRYKEAIGAFDQAIEINPRNPRPWKRKGMVLKKAGHKVEAKHAFDKAKELKYAG